MYRVKYCTSKTKGTVVGSDQDMRYYSDTKPWHLDQVKVKVCEDNDHLFQQKKNAPFLAKNSNFFTDQNMIEAIAQNCARTKGPTIKIHKTNFEVHGLKTKLPLIF